MNRLILNFLFLLLLLSILGCTTSIPNIPIDNNIQSNDYNQMDCPFGEINDPYPGKCGRYVDANNNQICDLSRTS